MMDKTTLTSMLTEHRRFMTPFQIAHFVLESESAGSWYGLYMQALRELHSRVFGAQRSLLDVERKRRDIAKLESSQHSNADLDQAAAQAELDELVLTLREQWQQIYLFYAHARHARTKLPELTSETRAALDADFWVRTLTKRAALDRMCSGRVSSETMRAILSMPTELCELVLSDDEPPATRFKLELPKLRPPELPESLDEMREVIEGAATLCLS